MVFTVTRRDQVLIERMLASGRYRNRSELVRAGIRRLAQEQQHRASARERFPAGSLLHLFTPLRNKEELALLKGSSLLVEDE